MTLAERITAVLAGAGFRPEADEPFDGTHHSGPFFTVTEGVGAVVGVAWTDATDAERRAVIARYASRLRDVGLNVEQRADRYHLYVSEG